MERQRAGNGKKRSGYSRKRKFHGNQYTQRSSKEDNATFSSLKTENTESESSGNEPKVETLREAILRFEEPAVFNNLLQDSDGEYLWKFLDWSLADLAEKLGDLKLPFRVGLNARTAEPQWDFKCREKSMTLKEFLQNIEYLDQINEWNYFDYKYMHEWFSDHPEILSSVDWQRFGFDKQGEDSTLWIGSRGAHTNCHQDSYGCNLVAQIHGRKRWILFPPDSGAMLHQTRIPYEESTVYSIFNFFCPSEDEEKDILRLDSKGRMIVLEPGQVLLIPSGWWHYVESLDLSLSINVWLPLEKDHRSRLGEAVVKLLVNEIGKGLISTSDKSPPEASEAINLVKTCIEQCHNEDTEVPLSGSKLRRIELSVKEFVEEYSGYVSLLPILETEKLQQLLSENRNRFPNIECRYIKEEEEANDEYRKEDCRLSCDKTQNTSLHKETTNILVNALCHPDVISKVTQVILESSRSE